MDPLAGSPIAIFTTYRSGNFRGLSGSDVTLQNVYARTVCNSNINEDALRTTCVQHISRRGYVNICEEFSDSPESHEIDSECAPEQPRYTYPALRYRETRSRLVNVFEGIIAQKSITRDSNAVSHLERHTRKRVPTIVALLLNATCAF